jgi:hypothetical protein
MPTIKVVVCTHAQAAVMRQRMIQDGFQPRLPQPLAGTVHWDATKAKPADPEMIFQDHVVLIGSK